MAPVQHRLIHQADPPEIRQLDQELDDGTGRDPHGKAFDPQGRAEQYAKEDDADVVHDRGHRRRQETLIGIQDAHGNAVQGHEKGLDQHDPGHGHGQLNILRRKARNQQLLDDVRRQHRRQQGAGQHSRNYQIEDGAGHPPALLSASGGNVAGENRNKGRAHGAAHQQIV